MRQLTLSETYKTNRRYDTETIFFAFSLFYKSPACYRELSRFLILPHPRTFRNYMSTINSSVELKNENIKNLKSLRMHFSGK